MFRPLLIPASLMVLAFISGVGLGLSLDSDAPKPNDLARDSNSSSAAVGSDTTSQSPMEQNILLSSRIRELNAELSRQKDVTPAQILADRLAFFAKYQKQIRLEAFGDDLKVSPEMAAVLGLTPGQQQAIERHLAEVKKEMDQIEDANTAIVKQTADGVTVEISPDAKGNTIKDNLVSTLTSEIGEDRARLFMAYDPDLNNPTGPLSGFAQQKRDIDINWVNQNGQPMYTFKDEFFGPHGSQGWWSMSSSSVPSHYQKYLQTGSGP